MAGPDVPRLSRPQQREVTWLALATLLCLLPFANKAFHIDDPIFLWTAEQISQAPLDFYGFEINWYGQLQPMYEITKNPPLTSFYLAAVAAVSGWSEVALHLGMLLPALALVLGVRALAARLCDTPTLSAAIALATPALLVSATTLMSDVSMLALWCWGVVYFLRALDDDRATSALQAGLLVGLCALTKYFGVALLPLLFVHGWTRKRRPGAWLLAFAPPLLLWLAYDLHVSARYGLHPFLDVAGYAWTSTAYLLQFPHHYQ
jgi:4-amino-4-deoxy-L-arabinose transferase-like glycosyltransferase